jgi:CRP-like cAMP-binding protein
MNPATTNNWHDYSGQSPLSTFFNLVYPLSNEAIKCINRETFPVSIKKGKFLLKPGSDADHLYLILKGVIRAFIKEENKEITTWINEENEIVGSIRSLGLTIPAEEYLEALEDSDLVAIPLQLVDYLYEHFPEANIIGRKILEENYRGAEERAYISRIPLAQKRYQRFIETRSGLVNRISIKHIASYLGMTLETLSRVRAQQAGRK